MTIDRDDIPEPVLQVVRRLKERGFQAFIVGGGVRDLVRGVHPKDFDVATSARPEEVQRSFPKTIPTGVEHGTVTVLTRGHHVEVTTFRTEGAYVDARRPSSVEFRTDVRDDLARRDFTINAMAFDPEGDGSVVDPFGGQADLAAGIVRCVGDPAERFAEDGLRPLRAVRFAAVLGFSLDPATEAAIPATLPSFRKVAQERVREEFTRLLLSERPREGVELLRRTQLLGAFLHELDSCAGQAQDASYTGDVFQHALEAVALTPPALEVRLAALLHDIAKPRTAQPSPGGVRFEGHERHGEQLVREVLLRLRYPSRTIDAVGLFVREHLFDESARWTDGALRRFVARLGQANLGAFFDFLEADRAARADGAARRARVQGLRARIDALLAQQPPLNARALALDGNQIMRALGVGPSPAVGEATRFLVDLVLEDPSLNTPERLTEALENWAQRRGL